ncbi:MAG: hypothetical protein A3G32_09150 [Deltaproteobacteria bacterium RIFCSPLOWO2_12_FULL_40_28]|nr:MAG: hypothetical protein A3C45_08005 [Deltaproteobacteria bacterium RIFCSPHIGHO2_02_FULL_40_28]OGQ21187.1 MAG: hypothetical protein A3E27_01640 [Deltaproteobacteria bacterium RIFCSPHIGHO2_12_FULL_40_32]OGQ39088.1 MAG: hypothetical protein A3I69_09275 [Deltaproteobacteria bacterium RIFCSPLOWO2_02_FULL_40_36]OGQ53161.1 MAG: hypothetical protein A3G32_09150 [Deltaproteobacteria bacterium RIFCSPLOWO2_12_FULL_40_28]
MIDLYPNATLPILLALFLTVLFILNRLVFRPTISLIEARHYETEKLSEKIAGLSQDTHRLLETYQRKIEEARLLASEEREKLILKGREKERDLFSQVRSENEAFLSEFRANLSQEKKEAELKLKQYVQDLAKDMVAKVLKSVA